MTSAQQQAMDRRMMTHAIGLSKQSGKAGEYPYAAVVCRDGAIVAESINRVVHDGDVTRHAEVVAISLAQKALRLRQPRRLRDLCECRALRVLLLCDPREPDPAGRVWAELAAHGRRVEVERAGR